MLGLSERSELVREVLVCVSERVSVAGRPVCGVRERVFVGDVTFFEFFWD